MMCDKSQHAAVSIMFSLKFTATVIGACQMEFTAENNYLKALRATKYSKSKCISFDIVLSLLISTYSYSMWVNETLGNSLSIGSNLLRGGPKM